MSHLQFDDRGGAEGMSLLQFDDRGGAEGMSALILVFRSSNHDLVLLDRDLDRAVAGPVLGVDRIVLDGGVEPQAVALLAMVERPLQRTGRCGPAARAS